MERLKNFRLEQGLTQSAMANKIGITLSMYEKVETGRTGVSGAFMRRFKKSFPEASIDVIFFTENNNDVTVFREERRMNANLEEIRELFREKSYMGFLYSELETLNLALDHYFHITQRIDEQANVNNLRIRILQRLLEISCAHVSSPFNDKEESLVMINHGCWLHKYNGIFCSVCGGEALMDEVYYESRFCPECGSKMDAEEVKKEGEENAETNHDAK